MSTRTDMRNVAKQGVFLHPSYSPQELIIFGDLLVNNYNTRSLSTILREPHDKHYILLWTITNHDTFQVCIVTRQWP